MIALISEPIDLEKLRRIDPGEWRRIHPQLYGVADAALRKDGRLHAGNELLLTGIEVDEAIEAAIATALDKIGQINSEEHLRKFVARTAIYKARDRLRAKFAKKSDDKLIDSLEDRIEKKGEKEFSHDTSPDTVLLVAELDVAFQKLWAPLPTKDLDLVWDREVMEFPHKEIAGPLGWDAGQVARRADQARERVKRLILKDPTARKIIEQLGYGRYLQ